MPLLALPTEPLYFDWWAVSEASIDPLWRRFWRALVVGLPPIGRGNEWVDCSPFGNHGYIEGTALPASWVDGLRAWALDLDGVDARVRIYDHASLDLTQAITVEAWIYPHETNDVVIAAKRDAGNYAWQLRITADPNNKLEFTVNGAGNAATSAASISENAWTHVIGRYDGQNISVMINGDEDGSQAYAVAISVNAVDVTLGSNLTGAPAWFDGLMGTARIWSRPLEDPEGEELFNFPYGMYQFYQRMEYVFNWMGGYAYNEIAGMFCQREAGARTANRMSSVDRGGAKELYPIQPGMFAQADGGPITEHNEPSGEEWGNPLPSFNVNVQGPLVRMDKKKKKYW